MLGVDEDMVRNQDQSGGGEAGQAMLGLFHDGDICFAQAKGHGRHIPNLPEN